MSYSNACLSVQLLLDISLSYNKLSSYISATTSMSGSTTLLSSSIVVLYYSIGEVGRLKGGLLKGTISLY